MAETQQQTAQAYRDYLDAHAVSSGGRFGAQTRTGPALSLEAWSLQRAQQQLLPTASTPGAGWATGTPGGTTDAATEAAQRAGGMPTTGTGASSTFKSGPIGLENAPPGFSPYLTTTDGQSVKGQQSFYQHGSELTEWQDKSEQQRVEWKQALWYAGFYGSNKPVLNGDLSPEDTAAMQGAMGLANLNGKSWQDAIAPRVQLGEQQGGAYTAKDTSAQGASGAFDQAVTTLRSFAHDNGIDLTEDFVGKQAKAISEGAVSPDEVLGNLRDKYVARAYPGMAEDIRAGQNVRDVAAPYIASMAKLLEVPEGDVNLKDPTIAKALQAVDDKGKPATVPLWQFEQEVKKDSRYQYTQNAWQDVGGQAYKVMQMFGLQG